jgi:hypothetical protein
MNQLAFITFDVSQQGIKTSISMQGLLTIEGDLDTIITRATHVYEEALGEMSGLLREREQLISNRKRVPARLIWRIGDVIFRLNDDLMKLNLQIDDTYRHLTRDLVLKRKWLEKVVILRRYIPQHDLIPEVATWGAFEKGTRRKAQALLHGK